jgi:hypothetical protein
LESKFSCDVMKFTPPLTIHTGVMCKHCGGVFGHDSNLLAQSSFLITRVNFYFLIWLLFLLLTFLLLHIVVLTWKATISCLRNGYFCLYHYKINVSNVTLYTG